VRNYLTDALGSTVALADNLGAVQTEYTYEPFGATTTSGASTGNTVGFTGREADATGLYYYRARYYHPGAQRFIAEDPLAFGAGDPNLHAYVFNSPTEFTDPTGEIAWLVLPAAGCAGGAVGAGIGGVWSGRKLAAGCAAGALIGLGGWAAGPGAAAAAAAAARAGAAAAAAGRAARAAGRAAASAARSTREGWARATGRYPTKPGAGGHPQPYSPSSGKYTKPVPPSHSPAAQVGTGVAQGVANAASNAPMPPPMTPLHGWAQVVGQWIGTLWPH
jgi:RHS repeat-associated protein